MSDDKPQITGLRKVLRAIANVNDWRFGYKVGVAPALALLALVIASVATLLSLHQVSKITSRVVRQQMPMVVELTSIDAAFQGVSAELNRALVQQAATNNLKQTTATVDHIKSQIQAIQKRIDAAQTKSGGTLDKALVKQVKDGMTKYSQALDVVMSMLEIDFNSAASMLAPFQKHTADVQAALERLVQDGISDAKTEANAGESQASNAAIALVAGIIFALLFIGAICLYVGRATIRSVESIADATASVAAGEDQIDFVALERGDELNSVVHALKSFAEQQAERRKLLAEQEELRKEKAAEEERRVREEQERAELERRQSEEARQQEAERLAREASMLKEAEAQRQNMLHALADRFDTSVATILKIVEESASRLQVGGQSMSKRAADNEDVCGQVVGVSQEVNGSMQTVASATEELNVSVREIARQVEFSTDSVNRAVDRMDKTAHTVQTLSQVASRIGEVVTLINSIASQTNLLALNATIEAARAGEAGKGFAVVASEVKSLAGQTAKATDEIAEQVGGVQSVTKEVVEAMEEIAKSIAAVRETATTISTAINEQSSATNEIANTVSRAMNDIQRLAENTTSLNSSAQENGMAAADLLDAMTTLSGQFERLQNEADGFVKEIRAA